VSVAKKVIFDTWSAAFLLGGAGAVVLLWSALAYKGSQAD